MTRRLILLTALFLLVPVAASAGILKIVVDDMIHPISEEFIERGIAVAKERKAEVLVIQIKTPGGLSTSTRNIIEKIIASPIPVVVWVAPSGSYAASAGFFILESADVAVMATGTNTGAAHPVIFGGDKMDDVMKAKLEEDSAAFMRSFVAKRGRNVQVAESAVRQSKSFTEQEALQQKLIDFIASNEQELVKGLDGREVTRFDGTKVKLHTAGLAVETYDMSLKQRILSYLMDPNVAAILFAIGMLALYVEFNHPGAILPGVVGAIAILLALFALNILPTRYAALLLIISGFVLFLLEAKFTSHGILGTGGVIALVIGMMLLVDGPIPEMRVHLWTALAIAVPLGLISVFLATIAFRAQQNKIVTGQQGLVGEIGVARTALAPAGKVFVHGELWNAVASGEIPSGAQVAVKEVDGLRLKVEPVKEPPRQS